MSELSAVRLCSYTLTLALGLSALAGGAVHLEVLLPWAALLILAAIMAVWSVDGSVSGHRANGRWRVGTVLCLALAGVCLLQSTPLPLGWLQAIAPAHADIWSRALHPFGFDPPAAATLSLAPHRTLVEALKFACYGLVFGVAASIGRERAGMQRLATMAFGLALAVALVTAGHQLAGAEQLYGAYRPLDAYSIAPLLNANNRAGYLNLGFFCGLGLLFRAGMRPHAALIGLGLAFLAAEVLLCESLGGSASLALGLLLVLLLPRGRGAGPRAVELGRPLQAGIVTLIGAGAASMAFATRGSGLGLDDRSAEKLDLFARAWQLSLEHFWLGIGRGAFGTVFVAHQAPGRFTYEHAENFVLQWATEWGAPVTLVSLLAMTWVMWPALGRASLSRPVHRAALVGCAALLLQNLVDLGLEVPALMGLACAVLGGLCGSSRGARPARAESSGRTLLLTGSGLTALCLAFTLAWGVDSPARLRHELHAALSSAGPPSPDFWARLRAAISSYPAEPYFPLLGSSAALSEGKNAIPWVARALERSPASAEAHVQLGRILHARGATSQALGALRRAVELDAQQLRAVLQLGSQWGLPPQTMATAAPAGPFGAPLLLLLARQTKAGPERLRLLELAIEHDPAQADAHHQLGVELVREASKKTLTGPCALDREACLARAKDHASRGALPNSSRTSILHAQILAEAGQALEAEELLARRCEELASDPSCADALMQQALANDSPRLPDAVTRLVAMACGNREGCGQAHLKIGHRFAGKRRWNVAFTHYQKAAEEAPSAEAWQALARAARQLGQETLAADAERRAGLSRGGDAVPPVAPAIGKTEPSVHPEPPGGEPFERGASD